MAHFLPADCTVSLCSFDSSRVFARPEKGRAPERGVPGSRDSGRLAICFFSPFFALSRAHRKSQWICLHQGKQTEEGVHFSLQKRVKRKPTKTEPDGPSNKSEPPVATLKRPVWIDLMPGSSAMSLVGYKKNKMTHLLLTAFIRKVLEFSHSVQSWLIHHNIWMISERDHDDWWIGRRSLTHFLRLIMAIARKN